MVTSLIINRHRSIRIVPERRTTDIAFPSDDLLSGSDRDSDEESGSENGEKQVVLGRERTIWGLPGWRVDTSGFANNLHSRILQKFPFLVEMFYWALNYVAYSLTKKMAVRLYGSQDPTEIAQLAQTHGIDILTLEHDTFLSFVFPLSEVGVQRFFLEGHQSLMTAFNQLYSLVHIPGTVA